MVETYCSWGFYIRVAAALLPVVILESILDPLPFFFKLAHYMCQLWAGCVSQMLLKSYIIWRQALQFISSQPSEDSWLLLNNTEGRDSPSGDHLLIAIRVWVSAIALRRKIRTTWLHCSFPLLFPSYSLRYSEGVSNVIYPSLVWLKKKTDVSNPCLLPT